MDPLFHAPVPAAPQDGDDGPGPGEHGPSYLQLGIKAEAMAAFFEAAARLYRQDPWRCLPASGPLFRLSCQALRLRGWIGSVSGSKDTTASLLCFRSLQAHNRFVRLVQQRQQQPWARPEPLPDSLLLTYEDQSRLPPALRAEIRQQGWPLESPQACPVPLQVDRDLIPYPLDPHELIELELMVHGLSALLEASGASPAQGRRRLEVTVGGERRSISIGWVSPSQDRLSTSAPGAEVADGADGANGADAATAASAASASSPASGPPSPEAMSNSGTVSAETPPAAGEPQHAYGRVPAALQQKVDSLMAAIDPFCNERLTPEYRQLIQAVLGALARKRPSPLLGGREASWCAGIMHAVGTVNFLFDRQQSPHCKAPEIYAYFGVSAQTGQAHSKTVRDRLGMYQFHWKWTLPSRWEETDMLWMVELNGFIQDARVLPLQLQIDAWQRGLIPYVYALGREACLGKDA